MESRIQEAMAYMAQFPKAKVVTMAQKFGITRGCLRGRLKGAGPLKNRPTNGNRLSEPEELAICRYIDRLNNINLAVRAGFVTDAVNYVLAHRSSKAE